MMATVHAEPDKTACSCRQGSGAYIKKVYNQSASDLWVGAGQQAKPVCHVFLPGSLVEDLLVVGWNARVPVRNLCMAD